MLGTIPKLKELGIHWATLDDRWFNNYGDWQPRADTFPDGEMRKMVQQFHEQGIKVQLWWLPLAVEDGGPGYESHKYGVSEVVKEHPDWLVLDKNGKPARMTRNLATLCPAVPGGARILQAAHRAIYSANGISTATSSTTSTACPRVTTPSIITNLRTIRFMPWAKFIKRFSKPRAR